MNNQNEDINLVLDRSSVCIKKISWLKKIFYTTNPEYISYES